MKKKFIVIPSLIMVFVAIFLFLFLTQPLFASKVFELCQIIDLRKNLPKGRFQKVSIVSVFPVSYTKSYEEVIFEVPADKMAEFEAGFRRCIQNATPLKTLSGGISELRIQVEKGKYSAYINYYDNIVTIRGGYFHRGFSSKELRKVFYDAGLKYTSGGPKERGPKEKEVNEPNYVEILHQSALKAAENAEKIKESRER